MVIPLTELANDSYAVIVGSRENHSYPHRLHEMGFIPGSYIHMFSKQVKCPLIIKTRGVKYAISRELVENILVETC